MKLAKNFVLTVILVSISAFNTLAGETQLPGAIGNPPPPPPAVSKPDGTKTVLYDDPNTPVVTTETSDYLFFEALKALLSVY
jgi:hypothetical protein